MEPEGVRRRLAAVLAANVAGYTRLMETDEEATLTAWWAARREIIDPAIGDHHGRMVKHTGDGFLAEFNTALDAVQCAIAMQTALAAGNADQPAGRRLDFRMGVNLGDIVVDDEDIYGDGVNIAARLGRRGLTLSAQAFRCLSEDGRKRFQKIMQPITYRFRG